MHILDSLRRRLDLLVALDALITTRSVTLAAERLGMSQPAMSRQLAQLRDAFADPLLVRVGPGMQATPRAEALAAPVAELLAAAEALYAPPRFDPATAKRVFRAAIPDVVAAVILPALLERLAGEAPGSRLELAPWRSAVDGRADLDFAVSTESDLFPDYRMQKLFEDHDVLAFAHAGKAPPRTTPGVMALDHIAVIAAGLDQDPVDRWLTEIGLERRITAVVPHYLLALQLVAQAGLFAILPSRMVARLGPALGVGGKTLPMDPSPDQQWLLYPPRLEADPGSRWIRALVAEVAR